MYNFLSFSFQAFLLGRCCSALKWLLKTTWSIPVSFRVLLQTCPAGLHMFRTRWLFLQLSCRSCSRLIFMSCHVGHKKRILSQFKSFPISFFFFNFTNYLAGFVNCFVYFLWLHISGLFFVVVLSCQGAGALITSITATCFAAKETHERGK